MLFSTNMSKKRILIVYRINSEKAKTTAISLKEALKTDYAPYCLSVEKLEGSEISDAPHLCVILGGDGTYLSATQYLLNKGFYKVPCLGINLGSLGFLTENRLEELENLIKLGTSEQLKTEKRSLIALEIKGQQKGFALNDIVIERGASPRLVNFSISYKNELVTETKADGLIISTPTGSTAYNLAAGGPILHPEVSAFVVTPISPHSLTSRPLIFSDQNELQIRILGKDRTAQINLDGKKLLQINDDCLLKIKKADQAHIMYKKTSSSFFSLLREKLKFGDRA